MPYLVGNPEDRFSHDVAHLMYSSILQIGRVRLNLTSGVSYIVCRCRLYWALHINALRKQKWQYPNLCFKLSKETSLKVKILSNYSIVKDVAHGDHFTLTYTSVNICLQQKPVYFYRSFLRIEAIFTFHLSLTVKSS